MFAKLCLVYLSFFPQRTTFGLQTGVLSQATYESSSPKSNNKNNASRTYWKTSQNWTRAKQLLRGKKSLAMSAVILRCELICTGNARRIPGKHCRPQKQKSYQNSHGHNRVADQPTRQSGSQPSASSDSNISKTNAFIMKLEIKPSSAGTTSLGGGVTSVTLTDGS